MTIQIQSIADLRIHLREERLRQGLGQDQIPGLSRTTVHYFETGKGARIDTVFAIMQALGARISLDFAGPEPLAETADDLDLGHAASGAASDEAEIDLELEP